MRNLNFPPKKKVDCENLVKTLCTVTSDEDICIWLRLFWSNGIATIQLTLFWIIFSLPKKLISWHFIVHCKRVIKKIWNKEVCFIKFKTVCKNDFWISRQNCEILIKTTPWFQTYNLIQNKTGIWIEQS